jgi:putative hydroxymethylpyrimidine transport system substrate-binding protein
MLALVAMVLLAGCGGGDGGEAAEERQAPPKHLRELTITLNGYDGPENVGILMADELGYFEEAGLDVTVYSPGSPDRPLPYVATRSVDFGVSHLPEVALASEKGTPIVAVGSLVPEPTAAMIWPQGSKIDDIGDLKGKTVGIPGLPFQESLLEAVLAQAGLTAADVKVKRVGYELVPALLRGRVDAVFGGSWNVEGVELEGRGMEPEITRVQDLGVPAYDELVVIARRDFVAEDPQLVSDFMTAVARGAAAAVEDPQEAVEVIDESIEKDPDIPRKLTKPMVEATLPVLSESGYMDPEQATGLVEWMREEGLVQREPPVSSLLTNDYLEEPQE